MIKTLKRILVVDDEPHMRRLVQFNLTRLGHQVDVAAGGREALDKAARLPVDLIVLDVVMPEMDGFAVLRELRGDARHRLTPVIMLTARGQSETADRARELGVQAFLTKPFSPTELGATVGRLLAPPP